MRRSLIVLSVVGGLLTILYLIEDLHYARGTLAAPGPGAYPILVGALLMLGFVGTGWSALVSRAVERVEWPEGLARLRVLIIVAAAFAYALLVDYIGHPIAGTVLTFIVLQTMGFRSWPVKLLVALAMGVGSYFLFSVVLGVELPIGSLFD
jgi:putative tricarboxylic transport membrane protein